MNGLLNPSENITVSPIDPQTLLALNAAWTHNALQLGKICLVIGFIIGAASVYVYMRRKYGEL
jgi:hypothetical protein